MQAVTLGSKRSDPSALVSLRRVALADAQLAQRLKLSESSLQRVAALSEAIAINAVYDLGGGGTQVRRLHYCPHTVWLCPCRHHFLLSQHAHAAVHLS